MTKFAPVAPIWLLEQMLHKDVQIAGDYHLLLAHDVLLNKERFAAWAAELREKYTQHLTARIPLIIMDNSVIELGSTMSIAAIVEAAEIVNANVIVLPDHIGDHEATLAYVDQAYDELGLSDGRVIPFDVMFVPQGKTFNQYVASMEFVADRPWIQWLGIPRDALQFMFSRTVLVEAASIVCSSKLIHLLGFSDNLYDDCISCMHPAVFGIDSAVPVRAGMKGTKFVLSNSDYGKRENFWTDEKPINQITIDNIERTRMWLSSRERWY